MTTMEIFTRNWGFAVFSVLFIFLIDLPENFQIVGLIYLLTAMLILVLSSLRKYSMEIYTFDHIYYGVLLYVLSEILFALKIFNGISNRYCLLVGGLGYCVSQYYIVLGYIPKNSDQRRNKIVETYSLIPNKKYY
jgi:predicted membrane channel-forming protein YqfA (hemolysin III family)